MPRRVVVSHMSISAATIFSLGPRFSWISSSKCRTETKLCQPDSVSNENSSDESSSDEMQVVGIVQPYADEPLAHTSDEDEDDEEDQDGLTPAILRA